jgi:hypothetical protein
MKRGKFKGKYVKTPFDCRIMQIDSTGQSVRYLVQELREGNLVNKPWWIDPPDYRPLAPTADAPTAPIANAPLTAPTTALTTSIPPPGGTAGQDDAMTQPPKPKSGDIGKTMKKYGGEDVLVTVEILSVDPSGDFFVMKLNSVTRCLEGTPWTITPPEFEVSLLSARLSPASVAHRVLFCSHRSQRRRARVRQLPVRRLRRLCTRRTRRRSCRLPPRDGADRTRRPRVNQRLRSACCRRAFAGVRCTSSTFLQKGKPAAASKRRNDSKQASTANTEFKNFKNDDGTWYTYLYVAPGVLAKWFRDENSHWFQASNADNNDEIVWFSWTPIRNSQNTQAHTGDNTEHTYANGDHLKHRVLMAVPEGSSPAKKPTVVRLRLRLWPGDVSRYLGVWSEATSSLVPFPDVSPEAPVGVSWEKVNNKRIIELLGLTDVTSKTR